MINLSAPDLGLSSSTINLAGSLFLVLVCALLLLVPRRLALLPVFITACYMTFGQQIVAAGLHFTVLRALIVIGYIRVILRREYRRHTLHELDKAIMLWSVAKIVFFTALWGSISATVNRLGVALDTAGLYFLFRMLVWDMDDIITACSMLAFLLVPLTLLMGSEFVAGGRNAFAVLGGVPEISETRNGIVRCQGPFAHAILAGTFGAAWVPMYIGVWRARRNRAVVVIALICCTAITLLGGSSGPVLTYCAGVLATAMWLIRKYMRAVRWACVILIMGLHLAMNDPVWFIFARVNVFSGSTGWHRSNLIDQTIKHFGDWWMYGTSELQAWGVWAGDVTNQFILEGLNGGIVTAILFVAIFVIAFSSVGKAMKQIRDRSSRVLVWAIGASLFTHGVTFLSVSYFDQNIVNFYLLLAAVPIMVRNRIHADSGSKTGRQQISSHQRASQSMTMTVA